MPFRTTGLVAKGFYVLGLPWTACHLLDGPAPVLFESGFTCAGRLYADGIRSILKEKMPHMLFLTHAHYDHCGATDYLKRTFPGLKVAASQRTAEILHRPNAIKLMTELSEVAVSLVRNADNIDTSRLIDEPFHPFDVDLIVGEGDEIDVGGTTVQVFATPGHTRDMLSYYMPDRRILVATESAGCQDRAGQIISEFLVDYDAYFRSLKRLAALPVDILCQGHHVVWVGEEEVRDFFSRSIAAAEIFREKVETLLGQEEGSVERVVTLIKAEQYDTNMQTKQPEPAYLLNLRAQVGHLAVRLREKAGKGYR